MKLQCVLLLLVVGVILVFPELGFCSVESTLGNIQSRLVTTILPLASIIGLIFAGLSFAAGSPQARTHVFLAIMGALIGFGSTSIISFIRGVVS